MRILSVIAGVLLFAPSVAAQLVGMSSETTRVLKNVSEMGQPTVKKDVPARALTFEEADDPTIGAHHTSPHEPQRAARKAAEKAESLSKKGRHEEAIAQLRRALEIDPAYYEAGVNLALELEAVGNKSEAETTFRGLMKSSPEHALAFINLGVMLCGEHRYGDAEAVAREALKHHNYSFKINLLLATALINEGHWTDEAKTKLEYAQVKYPEAKALLQKWPAARPN